MGGDRDNCPWVDPLNFSLSENIQDGENTDLKFEEGIRKLELERTQEFDPPRTELPPGECKKKH